MNLEPRVKLRPACWYAVGGQQPHCQPFNLVTGAHLRGQQPQQFLESEGFWPRGVYRMGCQVFCIYGLDRIASFPEYGEDREAPKRSGNTVKQQDSLSEDRGGPDDGVGESPPPSESPPPAPRPGSRADWNLSRRWPPRNR